jgi:hypothetical protein
MDWELDTFEESMPQCVIKRQKSTISSCEEGRLSPLVRSLSVSALARKKAEVAEMGTKSPGNLIPVYNYVEPW